MPGESPTADSSLSIRCTPDPADVRIARGRIDQYLRSHRIPAELLERSLLVASELLTNAMEASPRSATIALGATAGDGLVTISVENLCPSDPSALVSTASVSMPPPLADRGRGLPLVAAAAARVSFTFEPGIVKVSADLLERT